MTKKEQKSRDSFIFYKSFYESMKELSEQERALVTFAIMSYQFEEKEIELTGISKAIFSLIKPQLKANNTKWKNGCNGGRPITEKKPKNNLNKTQTKRNVNVNVKEEYILSLENDIQKPLKEWLDYRVKLKDKKQWEYQYKKLKAFSNPQEVVDYSIGQGYQGLFEPSRNQPKTSGVDWSAR